MLSFGFRSAFAGAVSPTAAVSGLSATAGDAPILLAPDPAASPDADAFGKQFEDASSLLLLPGLTSLPQVLGSANQPTVQVPDTGKTDWNRFSLTVIPSPEVPQDALSLHLSLAVPTPEQPASTKATPAPEVEQPLAAEPAVAEKAQPILPQTVSADSQTSTRVIVPPQQPQTSVAGESTAQAAQTDAALSAPSLANQTVPLATLPASRLGSRGVSQAVIHTPAGREEQETITEATPQRGSPTLSSPVSTAASQEPRGGSQATAGEGTPPQPAKVTPPAPRVLSLQPQASTVAASRSVTLPATSPSNVADSVPTSDAPPAITLVSAPTSLLASAVAATGVIPQAASPELPATVTGQQPLAPSITPLLTAPRSNGAIGAREPVAPKLDSKPTASQQQGNSAPTAIYPPALPDPALPALATSSPPKTTQAALKPSPSDLPPAPANAGDPQQPSAQPDTTPPAAVVSASQLASGELAFAVKVTPQETSGPAVGAVDGATPLDVPAAAPVAPVKDLRRPDTDGSSADSAPRDTAHPTPLAGAPAVIEKAAAPPSSVSEIQTPTPLPANQLEAHQILETPATTPPGPIKQLSIQVGQLPQQKVEVRVVERAGELQVAVRSANPDLAQGLRQGVSDLVSQLQQSGFHADAWRPGTPASSAPAGAEKPQTQAGPQHNNSQNPSGGQQDRQQGNQNPSRRPQWVEELETTFAGSGDRFAGEIYGISR